MALNGADSSLMLAAVLMWRKACGGVDNPTLFSCSIRVSDGGVVYLNY